MEHGASLSGDADLGRKRARQLEISGRATKLKRATLSRSFEKLQSVPIKSIVSKQLFHHSISRGSQTVVYVYIRIHVVYVYV